MVVDGLGGHRAGNRCNPAADVDQVAQDVPFHAEIECDHVRATTCGHCWWRLGMVARRRGVLIEEELRIQTGLPGETLTRHDLAGEVASYQAGALPGLVYQAGVVEIGRRQMPFIAPWTRVSRTKARVSTPSMPMMPCLARNAASDSCARSYSPGR